MKFSVRRNILGSCVESQEDIRGADEPAKGPAECGCLAGKDAEKMQTLIDALEDNDDVQNVYTNYESDGE